MGTEAVSLASMVDRLALEPGMRHAAMLSSVTTGNPTLRGLRTGDWTAFVALTYGDEGWRGPDVSRSSLEAIAALAGEQGLAGSMDAVVVDPFHTYESSVRAIALGLELLRPGGMALVHDCLPPVDLIGPDYVPGWWCGRTFAAFHDLCDVLGLAWCTVDADFGIGMCVGVPASPMGAARDLVEGPRAVEHDQVDARYRSEPFGVMRAVDEGDAWTVMSRLLVGEAVDDLLIRGRRSGPHAPSRAPRRNPWRQRPRRVVAALRGRV